MKNKIGRICGFVTGILVGFLAITVLSHFHPEEDLAGILIVTLVVSGVFFAFLGSLVQTHLLKRRI